MKKANTLLYLARFQYGEDRVQTNQTIEIFLLVAKAIVVRKIP